MSIEHVHITHVNLAKGFRGGERQTLNLIEGLATRCMPQLLVCRRDSELHTRCAKLGVETFPVGHPLNGHLSVPATDILHIHEARGAYWAAIEHQLRGKPYLITRRIPNPISDGFATRMVYRNAAKLIGVSHDTSALLSAQTGRAVDTVLDSCTPHAVDRDKVRAIRAQLGVGPVIGHVGALNDCHKGQSVLIEAFHLFAADCPDARLVLVGDGPDRKRFEQLAKSDPRIVFTGFRDDVGNWIAAMDVFAFPSREEGLGSSVLDAMLLDVPVIASGVGGLPELIGADERGVMIAGHEPAIWARALRHLLDEVDLRKRLTGAARAFAKANDVAAMTTAYIAFYSAIASCEARRRSP